MAGSLVYAELFQFISQIHTLGLNK
jgi:hypothetical protein